MLADLGIPLAAQSAVPKIVDYTVILRGAKNLFFFASPREILRLASLASRMTGGSREYGAFPESAEPLSLLKPPPV